LRKFDPQEAAFVRGKKAILPWRLVLQSLYFVVSPLAFPSLLVISLGC